LLAGPYELTHKNTKGDRLTICIMGNNIISSKKYKGAKLESERKYNCNDFD
jgi:hypothetical protein